MKRKDIGKKETLERIISIMDVWPKNYQKAPTIHGWEWRKIDDELMLVQIGVVSTIAKSEWVKPDGDDTTRKASNSIAFFNSLKTAKPAKKIYIAGPMTGYDNFNRDEFNSAAEKLTSKGHVALNPAILPDGLSQAEYMQICISMLQMCDGILLLKGWKKSAGARAEYALAKKLELDLFEEQ